MLTIIVVGVCNCPIGPPGLFAEGLLMWLQSHNEKACLNGGALLGMTTIWVHFFPQFFQEFFLSLIF